MKKFHLPDKVEKLVKEVEKLTGTSIKWEEADTLRGRMSNDLVDGAPTIRYREFSIGAAAEELLHLKLRLSGYPRLKCPENLNITRQVMDMLQNVIEHQIIYPELESIGFKPRKTQASAVLKQFKQLSEVELGRLSKEPELRALFAIVYVRANVECDSDSLKKKLDSRFSHDRLKSVKNMAKELILTIQTSELLTRKDFITTAQRCLSILSLSHQIGIVG